MLCGDAVPSGATTCPTCGKELPVPAAEPGTLPARVRRRLALHRGLRAVVVTAVVVGIVYFVVSAVWSGPPTFVAPLTESRSFMLPAGNFTYLAGSITGEDYITGNFTVVNPPGARVSLLVFSSSEFLAYVAHLPAATAAPPIHNVSASRIVFAAPYTDTFYFVFENPYPAGSGIEEQIYASTHYQTNVIVG